MTSKQSRNVVLTLAITFEAEKIIMFSDSNRGIYIYNNTLAVERSIYPLSTPEVRTNVVNLSWIPNGLNSSDFKYDIYKFIEELLCIEFYQNKLKNDQLS